MKYSTLENTDVTKAIENGKTKAFPLSDRQAAEAYARQKRSYIYDLYLTTKDKAKHL